jgi:hypothetical protein
LIVCKIFDNSFLDANPSKLAELSSFVSTSELIGEDIRSSDLNTDNAWIECTVRVFYDYERTLFRHVPLNTEFDVLGKKATLKWKKLNANLMAKLESYSAKYYERLLKLKNDN